MSTFTHVVGKCCSLRETEGINQVFVHSIEINQVDILPKMGIGGVS